MSQCIRQTSTYTTKSYINSNILVIYLFIYLLLFQLFCLSTSWTQSSALRVSWLAPLMRHWRATTLKLAVMAKAWQSMALKWCVRRTLSPPMVSSTLLTKHLFQTQVRAPLCFLFRHALFITQYVYRRICKYFFYSSYSKTVRISFTSLS